MSSIPSSVPFTQPLFQYRLPGRVHVVKRLQQLRNPSEVFFGQGFRQSLGTLV